MNLELGPILRSIGRRKSLFALVVLELASGFTIISCVLLACSWYRHVASTPSGHRESDLVEVYLFTPSASSHAAQARDAAIAREDGQREIMARVPGVVALAPVSTSLVNEHWMFPTRFSVGGPSPRDAYGWTVNSDSALPDVLGLRFIEGDLPARRPAGERTGLTVISRCVRDALFPPGAPAVGRELLSEGAGPKRIAAVVEDVVMRAPFFPHANCAVFHLDRLPEEREAHYLVRVQEGQRPAVIAALGAVLGPSRADRLVRIRAFAHTDAHHYTIANGIVVILTVLAGTVGVVALLGALAVASFLVSERSHQIGLRRALGATRAAVVRYFLVESAVAAFLGLALGGLFTLPLFLLMKPLFSGLDFRWSHVGFTAALLWVDATLAAMIPASRAANISPSVARRGS